MNKLKALLIIIVVLFIFAAVFGWSAYTGEQNYKNTLDQKIAVAVVTAKKQQIASDAKSYATEQENPLLTYTGPSEYGSVTIQYPKTWSVYMIAASAADGGGSTPINGYFEPGIVPDTQNSANVFALRVQVIQQPYSQSVQTFDSQAQNGQVTVKPYALPKVPSSIGVMVNGAIEQNIQGSMVIVPLRQTTLEVWTESTTYESDFNNIILPNLSFSP